MRRLLIALALVTAGLTLPAGFAAAHTESFNTNLSIEFVDRDARDVFRGFVSSPNENCESDRKVRLLRRLEGPDVVIDTDRSEDSGRWAIDIEGAAPPGEYYARVSERTTGGVDHTHVCERAKSDLVAIVP